MHICHLLSIGINYAVMHLCNHYRFTIPPNKTMFGHIWINNQQLSNVITRDLTSIPHHLRVKPWIQIIPVDQMCGFDLIQPQDCIWWIGVPDTSSDISVAEQSCLSFIQQRKIILYICFSCIIFNAGLNVLYGYILYVVWMNTCSADRCGNKCIVMIHVEAESHILHSHSIYPSLSSLAYH